MSFSRRLTVALAATCLTGASAAQVPPAADRPEVEAMAERATERIRALQREADDLATRERSVLVELRRLEVQRQIKAEELNQIQIDAQNTGRQLEETAVRVKTLEETVARQRPEIASRLAALYRLGRPGYARLLFGVEDLRAFSRVYRLVAAIAESDRRQIQQHRSTLEALQRTQAALMARRDQVRKLEQETRRARQDLDRSIAAQNQLITSLDSERDLNAQLIGELQQAQQRLQASLAEFASGGSAADATATLSLRPFRGDLDWPVAGRVTTHFGLNRQTRFGTTIVRNGIDIAAEEGTAVTAAYGGQVVFSDAFTGFGYLVIVDHGGQSYTLYGYLATLGVTRGTRVPRGGAIGTVGRSPAGGPALYFEVRIDGRPVDPLEWLKRPGANVNPSR